MKKFISLILSVCLILTLSITASAAITGDVDCDNKLSASDARLILRASVGLESFDSLKTLLGDIDFDGKLSASDARLALRASVGLEFAPSKAFANEYEAFVNGQFNAIINVEDGEMDQRVEVAITDKTAYMSLNFEGISAVILINEQGQYLLLNDNKTYMELDDSFFQLLGMSAEEFKNLYKADSSAKSLSEAKAVSKGSIEGIPCTVYTLDYGTYSTDIYLNGKKLVAMVSHDSGYEERMLFDSFSVYVSSEYASIPAGFTKEESF